MEEELLEKEHNTSGHKKQQQVQGGGSWEQSNQCSREGNNILTERKSEIWKSKKKTKRWNGEKFWKFS